MSLVRLSEEFVGRGTPADIARRAMSDSDLPFILADVASKSLRRLYQAQPKLFMDFTSKGTLPDYKESTRAQLNDVSDLEEVGQGGEFKVGVVNDSGEKIKLGYYGKKFIFTHVAIMNDDLNALALFPTLSASAAVRLENKLVFEVLTGNHKMSDGQNLFHLTHGNLATGAAMDEAKIEELVQKVMNQKTSAKGDFLSLIPNLLIAGTANLLKARKLTASTVVPNETDKVAVFAGQLKPIISPWIAGNSYYVACSSDQADGIEVAYLDGQEDPVLTSERDFDTSGLKMKIEHSFGVKALDWRPFAKNPGN
jgi:hypothetical protein